MNFRPFALAFLLPLAACPSVGPTAKPITPAQSLFAAESVFTGVAIAAEAYVSLPACGGTATICSDPKQVPNIAKGLVAARDAFSAAEIAVLGCTASSFAGSKATPPTATCGTPITDQTQAQALITAATLAAATVQSAVPVLTGK